MIDPTILSPGILNYVTDLFPTLPPVFHKIDSQAREERQPIVSIDAGMFMHIITKLMNAERILEVGCNIGYSTTWMATALPQHGCIDTIEINPETAHKAEENFLEANLSHKIFIHVGAALDVIPNLNGPYDIIFIDAVKKEYKDYVRLALPKLRQGGLILVDNVLWSGKVAENSNTHDATTAALDDFNQFFMTHGNILSTILTIGDGLGFGLKV
jgi:caffeoyl-CoA O-methyltransferase